MYIIRAQTVQLADQDSAANVALQSRNPENEALLEDGGAPG